MLYTQMSILNSIRTLYSDSWREYTSSEVSSYLSNKSVIHQKSCPHTPQQNEIANRENHRILETIQTLLVESLVPSKFWCEAAHTDIHMINKLPSYVMDKISPLSVYLVIHLSTHI